MPLYSESISDPCTISPAIAYRTLASSLRTLLIYPERRASPPISSPDSPETSARKSPCMSFECRMVNFCVRIDKEILWKIVMCCVFYPAHDSREDAIAKPVTYLPGRSGRAPWERIFQTVRRFPHHLSPVCSYRISRECHGQRTGKNPLLIRHPV